MIYANVGRDGVIVFEPHADPTLGRLPVGHATNKDAVRFKKIVSVNARHSRDNTTLLVLRVPEANTEDEALAALKWFRELIEMRMDGKNGWPPLT